MVECAVSNCDSLKAKREWCGKHYLRWRKYGDPEYLLPRYSRCRVGQCAKPVRSALNGYCEMHYYRIRRNGDALMVVDTRKSHVKYRAAHARVTSDRGRARLHACTDCGAQAHHWSYVHSSDPNEMTSPGGQPYSLDPRYYQPRCAPCHAAYDGTGANQYTRALPGG